MMVRSRSVFATGLLLSLMMCGGISQPMAQTLPAPVIRFGIGSVVSSADPPFPQYPAEQGLRGDGL